MLCCQTLNNQSHPQCDLKKKRGLKKQLSLGNVTTPLDKTFGQFLLLYSSLLLNFLDFLLFEVPLRQQLHRAKASAEIETTSESDAAEVMSITSQDSATAAQAGLSKQLS